MRLKIKHFDKKVFESKMQHLKDIDFTLFVDDIPQSQDELTDLNILVLQEPNEYFGSCNTKKFKSVNSSCHCGTSSTNNVKSISLRCCILDSNTLVSKCLIFNLIVRSSNTQSFHLSLSQKYNHLSNLTLLI